jgi:hypothetical protein
LSQKRQYFRPNFFGENIFKNHNIRPRKKKQFAGKNQNNFRAFGAKPLEDVIKNLRAVIMTELETALAQQVSI